MNLEALRELHIRAREIADDICAAELDDERMDTAFGEMESVVELLHAALKYAEIKAANTHPLERVIQGDDDR